MNGTVGLVLVSHSADLAAGLRELLRQVAGDTVAVTVAGGDDDGGLGTSYDLIRDAIAEAGSGGGVLVLPDLGSSVLTAKALLEQHPDPGVRLVDAPFVEGAVAAAVIAATGADLDTVADAAEEAWHARKL
ncbi:dihydroxyacetone kinase phosphoryl donor subunit DhaM [Catellatospora aurea]|uniref:phosphoenolpyruvate--glycerone phosphotransferase n=1 Tax=Catellatospora aurea TaxID=1337874 RepID=A0ABW2H6V3_9ACTN